MGVNAEVLARRQCDCRDAGLNREFQDKGFLLTSGEDLIDWARTGSLSG